MTYAKLKAWTAGALMATAAVGGTGYFAATGSGQTGGTDPTARPTARQTSRPGPSDAAEIRQAEAAVRVAEAELLKARAILRQSPEDRVAEAEVRVAEAKLEAAKVQLVAIGERATRAQEDPKPNDLAKLRKEKLAAARTVLEAETQGSLTGRSVATVYTWSKRVLEAERELDPSAANRLKAAREHFNRMKKIDDAFKDLASMPLIEKSEVTFYRAEAEAWLKEAEVRPAAPRERLPGGGAAAPELGPDGVQPLPQLEPPATPPVAPEGFRGTVRKVEGTTNDLARGREVHVTLTPGADAGLQYGTVLTLYREAGGSGKYLGTVTIFRLDAKEALGRFTPANPRKIGADDLPKTGDELVPDIRSR